jgi:uncharacterized protein (TIGR00255 family)
MIKSMTGFGQAVYDNGSAQLSIEVKSLNSKFFDLTLRVPKAFADRELELRNIISEKLERGKVSVTLEYVRTGDDEIRQSYNSALFKSYFRELKNLADDVGISANETIFGLALASPDVIQARLRDEVSEEEWQWVRNAFLEVIAKCDSFRIQEGKSLHDMLAECCAKIRDNLSQIEALDPERVARIRERLKTNAVSYLTDNGFDPNRLEQEILYYIEKLDINEEKVRLKTHLDYFLETLDSPQSSGKKLAFISQEIGREINTIGSKANDAAIQKHVVVMKEELEKIKEQLNNAL